MKIPKVIEPISTNKLTKKETKALITQLANYNYILEPNSELKITKCREKITLITHDNKILLFSVGKSSFLPHINIINDSVPLKIAYLDEGARKPLFSGADVMMPGIFKFINKIDHWKKGECVVVKIGEEVIGIGIASVDSISINKESKGVGIEMIHVKNDVLCSYK